MTLRAIPPIWPKFIEQVEGKEYKAYLDNRAHTPIWTIGCGHTEGVKEGDTCTDSQIDKWLVWDGAVASHRLAINVHPNAINQLNDYRYSALLSFVYNEGADPNWHIWPALNRGMWANVPILMRQFIWSDGEKNKGLVNRRELESQLWNGTHPLCKEFPLNG